ncbi:MAG: hypothetical protein NZ951_07655 [Dehalococcoidia bacterium]|nr:hypothetical protein [Dehalococcoidia bacterium]MDW8120601.1 hypothetical protein [Chloroflexota bacterium]
MAHHTHSGLAPVARVQSLGGWSLAAATGDGLALAEEEALDAPPEETEEEKYPRSPTQQGLKNNPTRGRVYIVEGPDDVPYTHTYT